MDLKRTNSLWLALSVAASFFAVGIPYWLVPYQQVSLPGTLLAPGLLVVAISTLLLCMYGAATFWRATSIATLSVGAAVMARVLVGIHQAPGSHNLWPFEIVIALMVGFACAAGGALMGRLVAGLFLDLGGDHRS